MTPTCKSIDDRLLPIHDLLTRALMRPPEQSEKAIDDIDQAEELLNDFRNELWGRMPNSPGFQADCPSRKTSHRKATP
jgi:hypothetical protein